MLFLAIFGVGWAKRTTTTLLFSPFFIPLKLARTPSLFYPKRSLQLASPRNAHRSNAMELISKVPVVEVAANVAMCDGGGGATGHPIEVRLPFLGAMM